LTPLLEVLSEGTGSDQPLIAFAHPLPRTVRQDCQVILKITPVIARPMSGSAIGAPSATTTAEATTARLT
jgi:hypothetical protein